MQAIVLKYLQLFCVVVFFDNFNCDQLELHNYKENLLLYQTLGCTAQCMRSNQTETMNSCYQHCNKNQFLYTKTITNKPNYFTLRLVCRDDTSIVLEITNKLSPNTVNSTSNFLQTVKDSRNKTFFIITLQESDALFSNNIVYIANEPLVKIQNLTANTTYNVFATVLSEVEFSSVTNNRSIVIKTLETNYLPGTVTTIRIGNFSLNNVTKHLDVDITWEPYKDFTCFYTYYLHLKSSDLRDDLRQEEIKEPERLYHIVVKNLTFGAEYAIGFSASNTKRPQQRQSKIFWKTIKTPTCLEWFDNNIDICAPHDPQNLTAKSTLIEKDLYNLNITWTLPQKKPNYYLINVYDRKGQLAHTRDVSGNASFVFLENVNLIGGDYGISLTAFSKGGNSTEYFEADSFYELPEKYQKITVILYISIPIFIILIASVILSACLKIKGIRKYFKCFEQGLEQKTPIDSNTELCTYSKDATKILLSVAQFKAIQEQYSCTICNDIMEIPKENIKLLYVIDEGAFGCVWKGLLVPTGQEVAVKMFKDYSTMENINGFYREIEIMKSVDSHPNIVGIIGHCTQNMFEMMLLTEYCSEGNLLNYLRTIWHQLNKIILQDENCKKQWFETDLNFETSLVGKESRKYKNIMKEQNDLINDDALDDYENRFFGETFNLKQIIVNRLYDYTDNSQQKTDLDLLKPTAKCDSFCKCDVEVIPNIDLRQNKVKVNDCECNENRVKLPTSLVVNPSYDKEDILQNSKNAPTPKYTQKSITSKDLINFAYQIANGMTYLSLNKVVHRDLAARNILVCSDLKVKIADFGLSRDVYQENMYRKAGDGKLPIKWLALESMTHQIYTSQSDVWSFGILLYEIVTLGSTPYPSVSKENLLSFLKSGSRMEKPANCSNHLYDLMLTCWKTLPNERPTFPDILQILQQFLSTTSYSELINLKLIVNNNRLTGPPTNCSYLKPL